MHPKLVAEVEQRQLVERALFNTGEIRLSAFDYSCQANDDS